MRGQVTRNRVTLIATVMLLTATGLSCGVQGTTPHQNAATVDAKLIDEKGRASLGVLEHRGTRYELRDLLDPAYRATSEDPFPRDFDPLHQFARDPVAPPMIWAGHYGTFPVVNLSPTWPDAATNRVDQSP